MRRTMTQMDEPTKFKDGDIIKFKQEALDCEGAEGWRTHLIKYNNNKNEFTVKRKDNDTIDVIENHLFSLIESEFELVKGGTMKEKEVEFSDVAKEIGVTAPIYKATSDDKIQKMTIQAMQLDTGKVIERTTIEFENCDDKTKIWEKEIEPTSTKDAASRALDHIESKRKTKLRKDWTTDPTGVEWKPRPILAEKYDKEKGIRPIKFPCIIQPKLDGIRCIYSPEEKKLLTRTGKEINMPHILKAIQDEYPDLYLDGELYADDLTLQDIQHLMGGGASNEEKEAVKFYCFDAIEGPEDILGYRHRLARITEKGFSSEYLEVVQTTFAKSEDDFDNAYNLYIKEGLEGLMIKASKFRYEWNKRIKFMLKYKPVYDAEFLIVDLAVDKDEDYGDMVAFICRTEGGKRFKVTPSWEKKKRADFLTEVTKSDIVNGDTQLTVEYRGLTPDGIPFHAVAKGIRDYE
jgi:ATP-dependent DNA ligase